MISFLSFLFFFFFNDTATTEIYTLSLHDALPICGRVAARRRPPRRARSSEERRLGACRGRGQRARDADRRKRRLAACVLRRGSLAAPVARERGGAGARPVAHVVGARRGARA